MHDNTMHYYLLCGTMLNIEGTCITLSSILSQGLARSYVEASDECVIEG